MKNRVINIIQICLLALCVVLLVLGAAAYASCAGVPNDDVGALHNTGAELRGMLLLLISGAVLLGDTIWFVLRAIINKGR